MTQNDRNSTRAGRSIGNLDDRKSGSTDPGSGSPHGRKTPDYENDIRVGEQTAALDHIQVSGIGDVTEDGRIKPTASTPKRRAK